MLGKTTNQQQKEKKNREREKERGYLRVWEVIQCLLVSRVGLLQLIQHEVAVTQRAPDLPIGSIQCQAPLEKLHSLRTTPKIVEEAGE